MKSVQLALRRFSCYKKVPRPDALKAADSPSGDVPSVAELVEARIKAAGPMSVADYMRMVLTSPHGGYYMNKDVFGQKGDFITSPEISQMFGEIVAVWLHHELTKIGHPRPLQLVELGPGRGTLMGDILRAFNCFDAAKDVSVHLVEVSPQLSAIQASRLCSQLSNHGSLAYDNAQLPYYRSGMTAEDVPVFWYRKIEEVPRAFSVFLAHEFFDALPIHKFQRTDAGWREVLVGSEGGKYSYVLSRKETPMSKLLIKEHEARDHVELCPEAGVIAGHLAGRIEEDGGIALVVDYGHSGEKTDTFRAFKSHQLHDPLVDPGTADLTADVDFSFLRDVMQDKLITCGPVPQGEFLTRMGIETRLERLMKNLSEENSKQLKAGCQTLIDPSQMGARFKVFAAFPKVLKTHLDKFPVAGF